MPLLRWQVSGLDNAKLDNAKAVQNILASRSGAASPCNLFPAYDVLWIPCAFTLALLGAGEQFKIRLKPV